MALEASEERLDPRTIGRLLILSMEELKITIDALNSADERWHRGLPAIRGQEIVTSPYEEVINSIAEQINGKQTEAHQ